MGVQWFERGDLWKSKARSLQLRLRDRFRVVAVDKHRRGRALLTDGYFSSTVQRWLQTFRDFRRDSLPSSSSFYRKRVSEEFNAEGDSIALRMVRAVAVPVLGNMCHVFMHGLNRVQVYGVEKLHDALLHRPKNKPLLTVSNHVASVDDPFVIASLLPPSVLLDAHNLRWTLCATDRCFSNPVTSAFFQSVKVLPVSRGEGIYQKGMDMAISKLNSGGWVHIFPEGSRSRDGGRTIGSVKRGVGRLILDADSIPMVVPFVHTGMQDIMPIGANFPRIGKTVIVLIGDPIHFDDLLNMEGLKHVSRGKLYDAMASRIGHRLQELKILVDKLALEQSLQLCTHSMQDSPRVAGVVQQVDWESLGIEADAYSKLHPSTQTPHIRPEEHLSGPKDTAGTDRYFRMGFSYEGGAFMSRMRGYMDPLELMGFAAKGLFVNGYRPKEKPEDARVLGALKAWKQYMEANVSRNWNTC
ncbi:tafazzin [Rhodamnia argentea]|uniref:Tafazzin family protein n=1 Tax=Rhodamnia argentea TaxID=178133 RepID=A0A8B8QCE7_9MYRT|nr:tafazzin [Rhodamnia argentea]